MTRSLISSGWEKYQRLPKLERESPKERLRHQEVLMEEHMQLEVEVLIEDLYSSLPLLQKQSEPSPMPFNPPASEEEEEEVYPTEPWPIPLEWLSKTVPSLESRVCVRCRRRPGEVTGLVRIVLQPIQLPGGKTLVAKDPEWWECLECHNELEMATVLQAKYRQWWNLMAYGNQDYPPLGQGHLPKIPNQETWLRATRNEGISLSQLESSLDRYRSR